jgi:hypothetical protein
MSKHHDRHHGRRAGLEFVTGEVAVWRRGLSSAPPV